MTRGTLEAKQVAGRFLLTDEPARERDGKGTARWIACRDPVEIEP